jgi:hypothetical protein
MRYCNGIIKLYHFTYNASTRQMFTRVVLLIIIKTKSIQLAVQ